MRGVYRLRAADGTDAAAVFRAFALREGFYASPEALEADFSFFEGPDGLRAAVESELGENLLVYAKCRGLLRVKKVDA